MSVDRLNRYVSDRMAAGIVPATAELELTHLHKAFRLAERAGKTVCPPFPQITVQNVRTGFFARNDFEAVRSPSPEAFRGPITFACLTGWRIPSEVLRLRWQQVDFSAGIVRLEPGTTKNDEGRVFPFGVLPEPTNLLRAQWDQALSLEIMMDQTIPTVFTGSVEAQSSRFIQRHSIIGGSWPVNGQGCRHGFPMTSVGLP